MSFRDNLLKKIEIKKMARQVLQSIVPNDSSRRIDLETMRHLLEMGPYHYRKERDLELYCENAGPDKQRIIVLDNELKTYHTTVDDVVLRKSPTVKEMLSIRNAIKILNDSTAVDRRKADTVRQVRSQLLDALDLDFDEADIMAMVKDGQNALENRYAEGVVEMLTLFAELLDYQKAPQPFQLAHHHIWGALQKRRSGEVLFGPLVFFNLMRSCVGLIENPISSLDPSGLNRFQGIAKGEMDGDLNGVQVFEYLKKAVMGIPS